MGFALDVTWALETAGIDTGCVDKGCVDAQETQSPPTARATANNFFMPNLP
jgi:hypothetical protein